VINAIIDCLGPAIAASNRVLRIMAIVQLRHGTQSRLLPPQLAAGKTPMAAIRRAA
jgi:hypothetical protein